MEGGGMNSEVGGRNTKLGGSVILWVKCIYVFCNSTAMS